MENERKGLPGLRAARELAGLSQSALARALAVPENQVQRWETGKTSPSVWAAVETARALGTTVEALTTPAPAAVEA